MSYVAIILLRGSGLCHFKTILSALDTEKPRTARALEKGHKRDNEGPEAVMGVNFRSPRPLIHTSVLSKRRRHSRLMCDLISNSVTHPSPLLRHPRGDVPLHDEPHRVHDAEEVLGMALPHAVHG